MPSCSRPLPGQVADAFGRKVCLFICLAIAAAAAGAGALCTNYWAWLSTRCVAGTGSAGVSLSAYVLATEAVGPRWRGPIGIATQLWFNLGEFALVAVAILFHTWRGQVRVAPSSMAGCQPWM